MDEGGGITAGAKGWKNKIKQSLQQKENARKKEKLHSSKSSMQLIIKKNDILSLIVIFRIHKTEKNMLKYKAGKWEKNCIDKTSAAHNSLLKKKPFRFFIR